MHQMQARRIFGVSDTQMSNAHYVFEDKTYLGKKLEVDGKAFINCTFRNCTLVYAGGDPPKLDGCSFENCSWGFDAAAARTLGFLSGLHSGGFDLLVEQTFNEIRNGETFMTVPAMSASTGAGDSDSSGGQKTILGFRPPRILKVPKKHH